MSGQRKVLPELKQRICESHFTISKIWFYSETIEYNDKQALYVTTGGPVASFFDAVIPVEETEAVDETHIRILKKMNVNQFIREPGSDIKSGEVVL